MPELCMYELEDIAWDEFVENGDHIVPGGASKKNANAVEPVSSKKPRYDLGYAKSNAVRQSASVNVIQRKEEAKFSVKKEDNTMLEKGPWFRSSGGAFSASLDANSTRKSPCSISDEDLTSTHFLKNNNMDSIGGGLCGSDSSLSGQDSSVDNNFYRCQPSNGSHTEDGIGIFATDLQDKENNDLLYYGWPEIENFEDVDRMFRSCDATFGLGIDNDDEMGWFSSSNAIEGSNDALNSSFNFDSCHPSGTDNIHGRQEVEQNNNGLLANDIDKKLTPVSWEGDLNKSSPNGSPSKGCSFTNGSGVVPPIEADVQHHSHFSLSRQQNPSEGKRKDCSLDNVDSFIHFDNLKQVGESIHSLDFHHSYPAETCEHHDSAHETSLRKQTPLINSNNGHLSNQVLTSPRSTIIKSEDSGVPSVSLRESSYASNQMQPMESCREVSFQNPVISGNRKKDRTHQCGQTGHPKKGDIVIQRGESDSVAVLRKGPTVDNDAEGQSEVNDSETGIPGEMDSSNIQESSCMSSVLDEVSIEASSFRQLQQIMEQLDIRTKLCIRDSLYRLARSAEQRHKCVNPTSLSGDNKDSSRALLSDESKRCTGYMDMETDTNPIDRSIAHLLFHRPSDPSVPAVLDAADLKLHTMVQVQGNGHMMTENLVGGEENT